MFFGAAGSTGAPAGLDGPAMCLCDEVTHEKERRWLVDPSADPASIPHVRCLEEAETLNQEGLLLGISADSDARSTFVDLENGKGATGDSEVGMTPGFDFGSSGQSCTNSPNPTQRMELLP
jgi:hypothetical protein